MAWRNYGNYSIDNNIVERSIRPIFLQRKSSLMFGSTKGVEMSVVNHTIVETCRQSVINSRRNLQRFYQEFIKSHIDYANLLPVTIGRI